MAGHYKRHKNMIRAKLCFAASFVLRDADSNVISAINVLEGIVPAGVPIFIPNVAAFALWQRDQGDPAECEGHFSITLDREPLANVRVRASFQNFPRTRTIVNVAGLVVPRPGELHFRFQLDDGPAAEYSLTVEEPQPQPVAAPGVAPPGEARQANPGG